MDPRGFPTTLPEFQRVFPDPQACAAYLEKLRWPDGFACPKCGVIGEPFRFAARPHILRCRSCKADISLLAGTVMQSSHTPLSTWFLAAYLVTVGGAEMTPTRLLRELPALTRYETSYEIRRALVASSRAGWRGLHTALGVGGESHRKRGPKLVDAATRFARMVDRNGPTPKHRPDLGPCHVWTGARDPDGYGRVTVDAATQLATHVAWRIAHGHDTALCLLHHCDNPPCVKSIADSRGPAHLFEGTRPENTRDMVAKGRAMPRKLGAEQVADVLASRARGETLMSIATRLGVSQSLVSLTAKRPDR